MAGMIIETYKGILHPGLIMAGFGILVLFLPRICRRPLAITAPIAAGLALTQMSESGSLQYDLSPYIHMEFIHLDSLSFIFLLTFCMFALLSGFFGEGIQHKTETGISLIYAGSAMGTVLAGDCISLVMFWEISIFASACVVFASHERKSAGAFYRYILLQTTGGGLLLAGFLVYMFHYGNDMHNIVNCAGEPCFWLIAAGIAVSAAVPPLHAWLSDAYPESTPAGSVYLSAFTTTAAVYLMIRLFPGHEYLVWIGAAASVYAACMAILENDIRRLLSYQIIAQTGLMTAAAGAGGTAGTDAASAHAVTSVFSMGVLMMCAGAVIFASGKSKITELGGMAKKMPLTAICFLIASLAAAGLPGLSGFVSITLVKDVLESGGYTVPSLLVTAGVVGTLLSVTLKLNSFVFFGPCDDPEESVIVRKTTWSMKFAMTAGAVITVLIGIFPAKFLALLAYGTSAEPYQTGNVLRFTAVFIGGVLPFFLFFRKMKPSDEITLDFDWFLRKPFRWLMSGLSDLTDRFFSWCDTIWKSGVK